MGVLAWLGLERKHWYYFDAWNQDPVTKSWQLLEQFQGRFTPSQADEEYLDTFERQVAATVLRRYRWDPAAERWIKEA